LIPQFPDRVLAIPFREVNSFLLGVVPLYPFPGCGGSGPSSIDCAVVASSRVPHLRTSFCPSLRFFHHERRFKFGGDVEPEVWGPGANPPSKLPLFFPFFERNLLVRSSNEGRMSRPPGEGRCTQHEERLVVPRSTKDTGRLLFCNRGFLNTLFLSNAFFKTTTFSLFFPNFFFADGWPLEPFQTVEASVTCRRGFRSP